MTEAELLRAIQDLAKLYGWKFAHARPALTSRGWRTPLQGDAGFPDCVLLRERLIIAELKSDAGYISREQKQWLEAFRDAGIESYVWRPSHWPDAILDVLKRPVARPALRVVVEPD